MLRGNLSTRPFYNERLLHVALTVAAVVLVGLTLFSASQFLSLSHEQGELSARIAADDARAQTLRGEAAQVRRGIDTAELERTVSATREVNHAIDQRVFSWTALFNTIERTIPSEVVLQAVVPTIEEGRVAMRLVVNARRIEDVGAFMDALERSQTFVGLQSVEEVRIDDGTFVVTFDGQYTGHGTESLPDVVPAADPSAAVAAPTAAEGR